MLLGREARFVAVGHQFPTRRSGMSRRSVSTLLLGNTQLHLPGYCGDGVRLEQALLVFERLIRLGVFLFFSLYQAVGHPAHTPALLRD